MKKFAWRKWWKIGFLLRRRISRLICSFQRIRVSQFPKLCFFLRTTSSTHFCWSWYFLAPFRSSSIASSVGRANHSWFKAVIFSHTRKLFSNFFFQNFRYHFTWHYWLGKFPIACLLANHNPEFRCVICTGITFFALVLHLNCAAFNQSREIFSLRLLLRKHYGAPQRKKLDHFWQWSGFIYRELKQTRRRRKEERHLKI